MDKQREIRLSKFLSLVLRHKPEVINLTLDTNGWANIHDILKNTQVPMSMAELVQVVQSNDKQRFIIDGDKIRANQGHSISVDLELVNTQPPEFLYHGTISATLSAINQKGLLKMSRNHVHLSQDKGTAIRVGKRRDGRVAVIKIDALKMYNEGFKFFLSKNGVWLTDHVPPQYIIGREI